MGGKAASVRCPQSIPVPLSAICPLPIQILPLSVPFTEFGLSVGNRQQKGPDNRTVVGAFLLSDGDWPVLRSMAKAQPSCGASGPGQLANVAELGDAGLAVVAHVQGPADAAVLIGAVLHAAHLLIIDVQVQMFEIA